MFPSDDKEWFPKLNIKTEINLTVYNEEKKTFLFNGDPFIICNVQENWPVGNFVYTITNCKMHPPEREINDGCPFGSVNTRKKTVPGCKIYML